MAAVSMEFSILFIFIIIIYYHIKLRSLISSYFYPLSMCKDLIIGLSVIYRGFVAVVLNTISLSLSIICVRAVAIFVVFNVTLLVVHSELVLVSERRNNGINDDEKWLLFH